MSETIDWLGRPRTMYRKRRLKKVAKRCGLDVAAFRVYAKQVKVLRKRMAKGSA